MRGVCHELLEHCAREHEIIGSPAILAEFEEKLVRKFRVPPDAVAEAQTLIRSRMQIVEPAALDPPACRDPDDDWVLAAAWEGGCACLVTGDRDLLVLEEFEGIPILPPAAFWRFEAERRGRA
ncbi:MAG: putative toxin-antitoxin system toxin component, PIN family [Gemmatimonadota bacterium]